MPRTALPAAAAAAAVATRAQASGTAVAAASPPAVPRTTLPAAAAAAAAAALPEIFNVASPRQTQAAPLTTGAGWHAPLRSDYRVPGATHSLRSELNLLASRFDEPVYQPVPRGGTPRPHSGADSGEPSPEAAPPTPQMILSDCTSCVRLLSEVNFLQTELAEVTCRYREIGRYLGSALETQRLQDVEINALKEQNRMLVEVMNQVSEGAVAAAHMGPEVQKADESAVMSLLRRTAEIQLRQQEITAEEAARRLAHEQMAQSSDAMSSQEKCSKSFIRGADVKEFRAFAELSSQATPGEKLSHVIDWVEHTGMSIAAMFPGGRQGQLFWNDSIDHAAAQHQTFCEASRAKKAWACEARPIADENAAVELRLAPLLVPCLPALLRSRALMSQSKGDFTSDRAIALMLQHAYSGAANERT